MKTTQIILIISIIFFIGSSTVLLSLPGHPSSEDYCKKAIKGNLTFVGSNLNNGVSCTYSVYSIGTCINQNLCEKANVSQVEYILSDGLKEQFDLEQKQANTPIFYITLSLVLISFGAIIWGFLIMMEDVR